MLEYTKKHPFYSDAPYQLNATFFSYPVVCRIEKIKFFCFGHIYRVVFYSRNSKWGFVRIVFSESSAVKLRDKVFMVPTRYGFDV